MRVTILAVGRLKAGPHRALFDDYAERVNRGGRALGLTLDVHEVAESRLSDAAARKTAEGEALLARCAAGSAVVALDEAGKALDSRGFATRIADWRDGGSRDLTFLIGGADGLAPAVQARADLRLAFGTMTWPHQLVRIMLAEQLYRATTILSGHPYHRD
ncbi:23S rRNA (pseudouridine(1915)-N(3))-methyltransferase RlmH [Bauldia sp.]|uniref:23S rRNA (pseudouridine(1915)-N(3))-methyltransferase RlmH n=1 Tax=Bauldia sp. TaxID=2575872 RepID=UPI003BAD34EB